LSPDAEFSRYLVLVPCVLCEELLFVDELVEIIVELPVGSGPFDGEAWILSSGASIASNLNYSML